MQRSLDAMKVALRVLTAIDGHRDPNPNDVAELKNLEPLLADTAPPDELACEVIRQALKRRAEVQERNKQRTATGR
jgi:hypothetical protein